MVCEQESPEEAWYYKLGYKIAFLGIIVNYNVSAVANLDLVAYTVNANHKAIGYV
jgi:hypothetical protein